MQVTSPLLRHKRRLFLWLTLLGLLTGSFAAPALSLTSRRTRDVAYVPVTDSAYDRRGQRLDVYQPRHAASQLRPVVVFIHGGNWDSGYKDFYSFVGRRLAKQGIVAVVISYRLAPAVHVPQMADDCARAVLWTERHIAEYGGDPARIFLLGHSAGGGLGALLATDDSLFSRWGQPRNPVRGVALDDAAGLNMYAYLRAMKYDNDARFLVPFGQNPAVWQQVSPYHHLRPGLPPFLVLVGGRTFPSISSSNAEFRHRLTQLGQPPTYTVLPGKKHVAMVLQLYWKRNEVYRQLLPFVGAAT